jgi:DNA-binding MarR family transcriptional regulator
MEVTNPAAAEVAAGLERLLVLIRWLSPAGLSLTSASTLSALERNGPSRLTDLAVGQGVTQPAMTQLVARLTDQGLAERVADPSDGRVVQVQLTQAGRDLVRQRRASRAEKLSGLLAMLSPAEQASLHAALPAMDALVSLQRDGQLAAAGSPPG